MLGPIVERFTGCPMSRMSGGFAEPGVGLHNVRRARWWHPQRSRGPLEYRQESWGLQGVVFLREDQIVKIFLAALPRDQSDESLHGAAGWANGDEDFLPLLQRQLVGQFQRAVF